jgi:hypothetical protein
LETEEILGRITDLGQRFHSRPLKCEELLTNCMEQKILENLTVVQLLKNFPIFYGIQRFITVFTRADISSLF